MKIFYLLCAMCFVASNVFAQTPSKINYQAVARNAATGEVVHDQDVYVVATIREGAPGGDIRYQEEHPQVSTGAFGVFSLFIGGGDPIAGDFDQIPWADNTYWLEIQMDIGNGLETLGTMQFVSVPYALHARSATEVDDADADPTNELISSGSFDADTREITLFEGLDNQVDIDLSSFPIADEDADSTNELITSGVYDPELDRISLFEGANNQVDIDLSQLSTDDADSDPTNELITSGYYDPEAHAIVIEEGVDNQVNIGLSDLSVDDADNDPTNEMITEFSLMGTNLFLDEVESHTVSLSRFKIDSLSLVDDAVLEVHEGGSPVSVDLSVLAEDGHWFRDGDDPEVYNVDDRIGVGTSEPDAKLHVHNQASGGADFLVQGSDDTPMLHVEDGKVGIGTDQPKSTLELHGSLGVGLTVIEEEDSPYAITSTDQIVICKLSSFLPGQLIIEMPDPTTCPGRLITVRKTGPNPGAVTVMFDFGGAQLDYGNAILILSGSQPKTVTLLSLGADGWTELISP